MFSAASSGLVVLVLLTAHAPVFAQGVAAKVTDDRPDAQAALRLSESLRATLTITGPAPLRVELPAPLLDPITDRDWKIQPLGSAAVTPAGEGRQCWSQTFRLDPYVTGESLPVVFAGVRVNGREVLPGGFAVRVISTVPEAKAEAARPVTGIEELPPPPELPAASLPWWVPFAVTLALLALIVVAQLMSRRPRPVLPHAWAGAALDRLEHDPPPPAAFVEQADAILRGFVERRFGIPAPRLTTAELLAAAQQAGRPVEETDALRGILDRCDRAKFAGDVPDDDGRRDILARCRQWLDEVGTAGPGPG